jgi:hypothetical protein
VQQAGVVEQHPLASPQAASRISFALNEDRRMFIVALPVRTQGAGRVENSFIEVVENTVRASIRAIRLNSMLLFVGCVQPTGLICCENLLNLAV